MKRRAHFEWNERADTCRLEVWTDCHEIVFLPRNHRLIERIEIGDVEPPSHLARLEDRADARRVQSDDGRHATAGHLAHQLAAAPDEGQAGRKIEHAGGKERVELAETVTGDVVRRRHTRVSARAIR